MNFDLSEEQQIVADLAAQLFGDLATVERVKAAESGDGIDRELWAALAGAGLLAVCLPESAGGNAMGVVELCLIAEAQGRHVAPVPLVSTVLAAMTVAEHVDEVVASVWLSGVADGSIILTTALAEAGVNDPLTPTVVATADQDGVRLRGSKPAVPALPIASGVLVPAVLGGENVVAFVDLRDVPAGVEIKSLSTSNHAPQGALTLDVGVPDDHVIRDPQALDTLFYRHLVVNGAIQLGVGEGAVAHAAEHVSTREQFGRPLATFQAVSQRAADGYILNEALRSTVLNAAWQLDNRPGDRARADALAAAYWAAEGTERVVLGAQHLHGGVGADIDYPVHRHFLWGMQQSSALGASRALLDRLGRQVAGT